MVQISWSDNARGSCWLLSVASWCHNETDPLLPGERDVPTRDFLQVVHGRRLPSEAVVGVVVSHDGGSPQLTELAVRALQLQLYRLELRVFPPVHWKARMQNSKLMCLLRIPRFPNKTKPLAHLPTELHLLRSTTWTRALSPKKGIEFLCACGTFIPFLMPDLLAWNIHSTYLNETLDARGVLSVDMSPQQK